MAQTQTPPKGLMWVYFIGFLYLGMGAGLTGPSVPYLAKQVGVGLDTFSILFAVGSVGGIFASLVGARGYDRWPGHKFMAIAIIGSSIFKFLIPINSLFTLMFPLMFLVSFFHITFDTGCNTLLIWWWGDKVTPYMNTMHFMFGLGAIISPLFVGQALTHFGSIELAYWPVTALGIPIAIALLLFPSPAIPTQQNNKNRKISRPQITLIWLFILMFALYVGGEVGFGNWVYTYAIETDLADTLQAAYLTSLFWGGLTAGRLVSIPLASRVRTEHLLWGSVLGSIVSGILMLLIPTSIWVGAVLLGITYASIFPLILSWAASTMHLSGKINGWLFSGGNIGAMIFPWAIGQLFVAINPVTLIWATILIGLSMVAVMSILQRKIKQIER